MRPRCSEKVIEYMSAEAPPETMAPWKDPTKRTNIHSPLNHKTSACLHGHYHQHSNSMSIIFFTEMK